MATFTTEDGLTITEEGKNTRVMGGRANYLFLDSDSDVVFLTYEEWLAHAQAHFGPRWRSAPTANISQEELSELTQQATLNWMYFYINNRQPVGITLDNWQHPQTFRIVQRVVERRFAPGSDEALALCAHLTGQSRAELSSWLAREAEFLNR
jgi:hypothetical protein